MQPKRTFGRRPQREQQRPEAALAQVGSVSSVEDATQPLNLLPPPSEKAVDVDRELGEWKAARKRHKRSFREPWRTLSIVCTLGFGLSSWLLPDSVADVAQLVTGGLGAASLFAGLRGKARIPETPASSAPQT
jgi:hypothetical protein